MQSKGLWLLALLPGCCLAGERLQVTEAEAKRAAIEKPAPQYPLMARQLKVVGKVTLEAVVAADGRVSDVRVISGNPILTRPATDALKKWRFKPFVAGGGPVEAVASLSFEFDTQ